MNSAPNRVGIFGRLSVPLKLIILSTLLAAIFLGTSLGFAIANMRDELARSSTRLTESEVADNTNDINLLVSDIQKRMISLSRTPPIQGIIRARKNDDYDEEETSTLDQWRSRLSAIFIAEMESSGIYDQLRYIDKSGEEIVRVDYSNGIARRVPDDSLQNKSNRKYFIEANKIAPNQVYVSSSELNREGDPPEISLPYKPVTRYAVPVVGETGGEREGIIIANVLLDKVIEETQFVEAVYGGDSYVFDANGQYIFNQDSSKEWGGESNLNTGENFFKDFPDISIATLGGDSGTFSSINEIFVYAKAYPNPNNLEDPWILLDRVPKYIIFGPINTIVQDAAIVGFGAFFVLFLVFMFVTKRILHPLAELSVAAENIGKGNFDQSVPVHTRDEIGKLAMVFNQMTSQLKELYLGLENKVKERTKELESANMKLRELDKVKDEFLSVASHELRTPLTAIDGLVSMIRDGEYGKVNNELLQPLDDINTSSERLIHLVNDLLSVSRIQAGRLKYNLSEFDIKNTIAGTIKLLEVVAKEKGIYIKVKNLQNAKVFADEDKVGQVLNNLIGNSLKFTDKGGITVTTKVENDLLTVYIKDTGIGMKKEDQEKIFERFQQLDTGKGRPAGTGLGLYISKELCQKMGGDLTLVESEPGQGSTFAFSIPVAGSEIAKNIEQEVSAEAQKNPDQKSDLIKKA